MNTITNREVNGYALWLRMNEIVILQKYAIKIDHNCNKIDIESKITSGNVFMKWLYIV